MTKQNDYMGQEEVISPKKPKKLSVFIVKNVEIEVVWRWSKKDKIMSM